MTLDEKLSVHLDHVIWQDQPVGTRMNAAQVQELMDVATVSQRLRAVAHGLEHVPFLLDDEWLYGLLWVMGGKLNAHAVRTGEQSAVQTPADRGGIMP